MKKLMIVLCAMLLTAVILGGCAQRAAKDAADTVSSVAEDMKHDADRYGKTDDDSDGHIEDATAAQPTIADMDQMIENGVIDDENDDADDGDNIDDDELDENAVDDHADENDADGGEHNDETMNDGDSNFI